MSGSLHSIVTGGPKSITLQHFSFTNESKAKLTVEIISGLFFQLILE
jgi:hypothetical protein